MADSDIVTPFGSVLVANRGEIARRVFHSCRELGLGTVAVFADPDASAAHVVEADCAVRLPGTAVADTYLSAGAVLAAARAAGAEAIHPGYGFLAEDADFAAAVLAAGLVWIGPPPAAVAAMGDKVRAKQLMAAAGVPTLPRLDPHALTEADLPVMIKASAGGGGRGMRLVTGLADLPGLLAAAGAEAERSFDNGEVFCEPYLAAGHHVEVQVLADRYGTVWAVGERECSIQRHHQKVVEEAPSPLVERTPGLREALFAAAVTATRAIDYEGAGTVEFIADGSGNFYFLEMNTRLQVEHPVTECTTGLDLVALQLQVAAGERLGERPPPACGHAIEARLYAEDPAEAWQPQTGTLQLLEVPGVTDRFGCAEAGSGLRLDSGVRSGDRVEPFYDAMLAKLIGYGPDRTQAARRLSGALRRATIHGLRTNRDQLVRVLEDPDFLAGHTSTALLERAELSAPLAGAAAEELAAVAAALADAAFEHAQSPVQAGLPAGWRNVYSEPHQRSYRGRFGEQRVLYRYGRSAIELAGHPGLQVVSVAADEVRLETAGVRRSFRLSRYPDCVEVDSALGAVALRPVDRFTDPDAAPDAGSLLAPLPGAVLRLAVTVGQRVARGEPLLWIEAMKMEHPVRAARDGQVSEIAVAAGDQVAVGDRLVVLDPVDQLP